jgi:branched-chain amino acid transport system permease protein
MSHAGVERAARRRSSVWPAYRSLVPVLIFLVLALVPIVARLGIEGYVLTLFTRLMILGIAAMSLNLLIVHAGLVSFGHGAFVGIGAYTVAILATHGVHELATQTILALALCAAFALLTGAVSLRTTGINFIMITLAFGQMTFFLATSLAAYGGDDGLTLAKRSMLAGRDVLSQPAAFYYLVLACLLLTWVICRTLVRSTFGRILQGARDNAVRVEALGLSTFRYQLAAYVIAGCMAGISGVLLANHLEFASPAYMSWQRSGELMAMVVVGGTAGVHAPILGAAFFILLEEFLSTRIEHWKIVFGALLIALVVVPRTAFSRRGRP